MLRNLQVPGIANCVKNHHCQRFLELVLIHGRSSIPMKYVDYAALRMVLLENQVMVNGCMHFVLR